MALGTAAHTLAAIRKNGGCWGTCGGNRGAIGGYFALVNNHVTGFAVSEKCLGTGAYKLKNTVRVAASMPIDKGGNFGYRGNGQRNVTGGLKPVAVTLKDQFVTTSLATISLTIGYANCGTHHLSIHRDSDS